MVVLKNTGLYGRAPAYELRESMTSTSQPKAKLVSHATMLAVFSVILWRASGVWVVLRGKLKHTCPHRTTPDARDTLERPSTLSSTLAQIRTTTRRDRRTHVYYVDEGSVPRAPSHGKREFCHRHPAVRGNVEGLVDHEAKVRAALIGSEDWKTPRPRTRRSAPLTSMASMSTLKTSSSDTKFRSSDQLHDDLHRKRRCAGPVS